MTSVASEARVHARVDRCAGALHLPHPHRGALGAPEGVVMSASAKRMVQLWSCSTEVASAPQAEARFRAILTPEELAANGRFVRPEDRRRDLVTRALARRVVAMTLRTAPRDVLFRRSALGQPQVVGADGRLRLSISHHERHVVVGVAWDMDVGVDVEDVRRNCAALSIAQRYFRQHEAAEVATALRPERRFFEYWTLKEAYSKARGLGLQLDFASFGFVLREGADPVLDLTTPEATAWAFKAFWRDEHLLVSVAAHTRGAEMDCVWVDAESDWEERSMR